MEQDVPGNKNFIKIFDIIESNHFLFQRVPECSRHRLDDQILESGEQ